MYKKKKVDCFLWGSNKWQSTEFQRLGWGCLDRHKANRLWEKGNVQHPENIERLFLPSQTEQSHVETEMSRWSCGIWNGRTFGDLSSRRCVLTRASSWAVYRWLFDIKQHMSPLLVSYEWGLCWMKTSVIYIVFTWSRGIFTRLWHQMVMCWTVPLQ